MEYLAMIGSNGPQPEENRARMAREFPAYQAEMGPRGVKVAGRPLDIDEPVVTVRVRGGETLVVDGPFAETKEFVGGLDLLDCADLDEAIEVEGKNPVARFLPLEIRPFRDGVRQGRRLPAFAANDDTAGSPYLLTAWTDSEPTTVPPDYTAWQEALDARGQYVLGGLLTGPATATTLRSHDGTIHLTNAPFVDLASFITCVDVITSADRDEAIAHAAAHPLAQTCAIELRPFHSETRRAERTLRPTA
ncbi:MULTISPECIES: YciI family protein [Kribbella]|uniref:YciI family protein n=1 Tax=Kribbella karoonensis TaxID=324851 RepID=A0ABN2DPE7_9ACTN